MQAILVMFKADGTRRDFPLDKPRIVVGRNNTSDLRIPINSVSRKHCEIFLDGPTIRLRDLGSSNGTFHNDKRVVQEAVLQAGDEISIGPVVFTLVVDGVPAHIEPVRSLLPQPAQVPQSPGALMPTELSLHDDQELPGHVPSEQYTPTVDLDDPKLSEDLMAQLERREAAERKEKGNNAHS